MIKDKCKDVDLEKYEAERKLWQRICSHRPKAEALKTEASVPFIENNV